MPSGELGQPGGRARRWSRVASTATTSGRSTKPSRAPSACASSASSRTRPQADFPARVKPETSRLVGERGRRASSLPDVVPASTLDQLEAGGRPARLGTAASHDGLVVLNALERKLVEIIGMAVTRQAAVGEARDPLGPLRVAGPVGSHLRKRIEVELVELRRECGRQPRVTLTDFDQLLVATGGLEVGVVIDEGVRDEDSDGDRPADDRALHATAALPQALHPHPCQKHHRPAK